LRHVRLLGLRRGPRARAVRRAHQGAHGATNGSLGAPLVPRIGAW